MHEISLCESLLKVIEDSASQQNFSQVKTVWLELGRFSCVEPEAMRFSFDVVMKGTLADGAKLELLELPARVWCQICLKDVEIKQRYDACPYCGDYKLQISGGEEMRIKELEVV
ncbi:hydrogenase maturation nickel metallochaperone HypA [Mariprofundus sp. NF]|uniref:hydrogenase maturation nickel metallochaperone HypA n=1 Tax=Mariprofundus sp. NF TaxID=2608716 RepID=UPI0015A027F3|nr:hydrogenase maturation nickel metallochaperone HypA [Mariprofundus sp. NF]NWF39638.1 hydrogenase maturation nickel metallochaperone HypA [Mariprofundus sp. NF]